MARHFLSQADLAPDEMLEIFVSASGMKRGATSSGELRQRTLVMFFEKASTRTRLSFEIGMTQLGGHAVYLDRESSQLSRGESIADTARVVSRYADLMMARVNSDATVRELAANATIPVINGLSDREHPCQSMADLLTIRERFGEVRGRTIAFVGDGNNNVTHSLLIGGAQLGARVVVASPPSLRPDPAILVEAEALGRANGGEVDVVEDPAAAVRGAQVVYADVWVSMGREGDREARLELLAPFQVNERLMRAADPGWVFMHCLPAHIGEEVTAEVAYGPHSIVFDQAENRLHVQKALMTYLFAQSRSS